MTTQSIEGAMPPLPEPPRNISLSGVDWWHAWEVRAIHAYAKAYAAPLLARVSELQADASRYRWLRDDAPAYAIRPLCDLPGRDWDAAIDAALAAHKEQP